MPEIAKERPILFSAPMVRAILNGEKTQTRRIMKHPPRKVVVHGVGPMLAVPKHSGDESWLWPNARDEVLAMCPRGKPGERLWVREAWRTVTEADALAPRELNEAHRLWYEADARHQPGFGKLRPSIHMPRWASRIMLEITDVRVERLDSISEADCWAEGIEEVMYDFDFDSNVTMANRLRCPVDNAKPLFALLWESINGPGSWDANPWLWAIEFRRLRGGHA